MALDDLTSQIELELAKRRGGKQVEEPWWVKPALTTIQQIPQAQQQAAMWQERKNAQLLKMMELQTEGFQNNFSIDDINKKEERLKVLISKNQENMNENALEYSNVLLNNIGDHREKVSKLYSDIDILKANQESWSTFSSDLENRGNLVDADYVEITDKIAEFAALKDDIVTTNADFLGLPQFNYVLKDLVGHELVINDILAEAKDQDIFSDYEQDYLSDVIKTGNYRRLEEEGKKRDQDRTFRMEQLVGGEGGLEKTLNLYQKLFTIEKGGTAYLPELGYGDTPISKLDQEGNPSMEQEELNQFTLHLDQARRKLRKADDLYKAKMGGDSYVADFIDDWDKPIEGGFALAQKKELKKLGYDDATIISMDYKTGVSILRAKKAKEEDDDIAEDSMFEDIGTFGAFGAPAAYAIGKATAPQLVKASKFISDKAVSGAKYMQYVTKLPGSDVAKLIDDKAVQVAIGKITKLREDANKYKDKPHSVKYKDAIKAEKKYIKDIATKLRTQGGKIGTRNAPLLAKMKQTDLEKLLKNYHKWNIAKLKGAAFKQFPKLAQGLLAVRPGGGFATYSIASKIGEELGDPTGGILSGAASYGMYKKMRKIMEKKGSKWLYGKILNKFGEVAAKRIVGGMATGAVAGAPSGPGASITAIIGGVVGGTMAMIDLYDFVNTLVSEEEEE